MVDLAESISFADQEHGFYNKMNDQPAVASIIQWIARISGSLIWLFLLFMLGGHLFGTEGFGSFRSTGEVLTFLFFPVTVMLGLIIAWKWDGPGGLIATIGMMGLFALRPELLSEIHMIGMAIPGLLFLLYWFLKRGHSSSI